MNIARMAVVLACAGWPLVWVSNTSGAESGSPLRSMNDVARIVASRGGPGVPARTIQDGLSDWGTAASTAAVAGDVFGDASVDLLVDGTDLFEVGNGVDEVSDWTAVDNGYEYVVPLGDVTNDRLGDFLAKPVSSTSRVILASTGSTLTPIGFSGSIVGDLVYPIGDVNHDGFADLYYVNESAGWGELFLGRTGGPADAPHQTGLPSQPVLAYGDFDADRFDDVLVGGSSGVQRLVWDASSETVVVVPWPVSLAADVASVGDVDRDGYPDVALHHPEVDVIEVYRGASSGIESSPSYSWSVPFVYASISGDYNADGFADLTTVTSSGLELRLGTESGLGDVLFARELTDGLTYLTSSLSVSDFNGDGRSDVLVTLEDQSGLLDVVQIRWSEGFICTDPSFQRTGGTDEYLGSGLGHLGLLDETGVSMYGVRRARPFDNRDQVEIYTGAVPWLAIENLEEFGTLGHGMAGVGDLTGDDRPDVVLSDPLRDDIRGYVWALAPVEVGGGAFTVTTVGQLFGENDFDFFGWSVDGIGDLNRDGHGDFVVGALGYDESAEGEEGAVYLYYGQGSSPPTGTWRDEGVVAGGGLGTSVAGIGDINRDGRPDFAAGAPYVGFGRMNIYTGNDTGSASLAYTFDGLEDGCRFGWDIVGLGDINGDGFDDVAVSSPRFDDDRGLVEILLGSDGDPVWSSFQLRGELVDDRMGTSIASAGDVTGDLVPDLFVGARWIPNGAVFLVSGDESGSPSLVGGVFGTEPEQIGEYVIGNLDADGDGILDLVTSSSTYDGDSANEGFLAVYSGECGGATMRVPIARDPATGRMVHPGETASSNAIEFELVGFGPLGRTGVRLHWQLFDPDDTARTPVLEGRGAWVDTGEPDGQGAGSFVPVTAAAYGLSPDTAYEWRMRVETDDSRYPFGPWTTARSPLTGPTTATTGGQIVSVSTGTELAAIPMAPVAPNPFRGETLVRYVVDERANVRVDVFSPDGRRVATIAHDILAAGEHVARWDGRTVTGARCAAGVYFVRLSIDGADVASRSLTLLR